MTWKTAQLQSITLDHSPRGRKPSLLVKKTKAHVFIFGIRLLDLLLFLLFNWSSLRNWRRGCSRRHKLWRIFCECLRLANSTHKTKDYRWHNRTDAVLVTCTGHVQYCCRKHNCWKLPQDPQRSSEYCNCLFPSGDLSPISPKFWRQK